MILTVTPNAAVDRTYRIDGFTLNRVHRPAYGHTIAGGKGINVARVFTTLGGRAVATGFVGGAAGREVLRALEKERIPAEFVRVQGESRTCIAVIDTVARTQTEVNEIGPEIGKAALAALKRRVRRLLDTGQFAALALCGSLPPGVPSDLYAELIELARGLNVPAALDSSAEPLRCGAQARPWFIKPNAAELDYLTGRKVTDFGDLFAAGSELRAGGTELVVLTRGAQGALCLYGSGAWFASPPEVGFTNAVASGDSFMGAFLWSWFEGPNPGDSAAALKLATGAGAANAEVVGAGQCSAESIFRRANESHVEDATTRTAGTYDNS